jgi:hypothetical protein
MLDISEPIVFLLGSPQLLSASAGLSGDGELTSAANITALAESDLSADGALTADGVGVLFASSSMSAEFTLSVAANIAAAAASLVVGSSNLEATSTRLQFATARNMPLEVVGTFTALIGHPVQPRAFVASSSLTATIYTNPRLLVLPTVEYAYTDNVLLERYPIDNGRSLLITSGVGEIGDFFAQEQIRLADHYFGGGRRHELTPDEEAAVTAAGYGDLIVTEFLS